MAILFLDEADVTAALDPALLYFGDIVVVQTQAHVFFDIVGGNVVAMHRVQDEIAILDNQFGPAFNKAAKPVRMKGDEREQPVQKHEHQSATEGSEKCRAAIDRAREHRRQDNQQDGVERCLARKRSFMAQPDHNQRGNKYDHAAQ